MHTNAILTNKRRTHAQSNASCAIQPGNGVSPKHQSKFAKGGIAVAGCSPI